MPLFFDCVRPIKRCESAKRRRRPICACARKRSAKRLTFQSRFAIIIKKENLPPGRECKGIRRRIVRSWKMRPRVSFF